jgi:hypothetical protein
MNPVCIAEENYRKINEASPGNQRDFFRLTESGDSSAGSEQYSNSLKNKKQRQQCLNII